MDVTDAPGTKAPVTDRKPFQQIPFSRLPDKPTRPHDFDRTESRRVDVVTGALGEVDTHYRVHGDGPPLLLVHGLMTSNYSWRYVYGPLGEHFRIYAPDLPGAGRTEKITDRRYDPRALAEWIGAFQKTTDIHGCPVVGNSLGGYLCMWLALREPASMSRLVNLHSPGVPTRRLELLGTASLLPGITRFIAWLARRNPEKWAHEHVHYYDETLKSREEAAIYAEPISTREGSIAFAKYMTETIDPGLMDDFRDLLQGRRDEGLDFPVPLLLLYAEEDPMVPPEVGESLSELIPSAEFVTMQNASHFAHVDAPERFVRHVLDFLEAAEPA